jgi:hypothetical protein
MVFMNRNNFCGRWRRAAHVLIVMLLIPTLSRAGPLERWLDGTRSEQRIAPTSAERIQVEQLFDALFAEPAAPPDTAAWGAMNYHIGRLSDLESSFVAISEPPAERRGHAVFLINPDPGAHPIFLQAPHRFHDRLSGDIVLRLLMEGHLMAAGWNTFPRYGPKGAPPQPDTDLAHTEATHMIGAARRFARRFPQGRVVQIHGFSGTKRRTPQGKMAAMVVSNGTRTPGSTTQRLVQCLKRHAPHVFSYPDEVQELGGTTNSVGQALRAIGWPGFVHMEINPAFRTRLRDDAPMRRHLLHCLTT